jgi:hypothetical protein
MGSGIRIAMTTWQMWDAVGLNIGIAQDKQGDPKKQDMMELWVFVVVAWMSCGNRRCQHQHQLHCHALPRIFQLNQGRITTIVMTTWHM